MLVSDMGPRGRARLEWPLFQTYLKEGLRDERIRGCRGADG